MSQVQTKYKDAEANYGSDLLNLVVARGYLSKLISTPTVKDYLTQNHPDILDTFELVVNTVSMDEAVSAEERIQVQAQTMQMLTDDDSSDEPSTMNNSICAENHSRYACQSSDWDKSRMNISSQKSYIFHYKTDTWLRYCSTLVCAQCSNRTHRLHLVIVGL
jgi:hypothetical protein